MIEGSLSNLCRGGRHGQRARSVSTNPGSLVHQWWVEGKERK